MKVPVPEYRSVRPLRRLRLLPVLFIAALHGCDGAAGSAPTEPERTLHWSQGSATIDLGAGIAMDINNTGMVVGRIDDRAFAWTEADGLIDLGTPDGRESGALAVNDSGVVVGWLAAEGDGTTAAFRWTDSDGFEILPSPLDDRFFQGDMATDINAQGEIAGWTEGLYATLWSPDRTVEWFMDGYAHGINDSTVMVGDAPFGVGAFVDSRETSGVIWPSAGSELGLRTDEYLVSSAIGINNRGAFIGLGGAYDEIRLEDGRLLEFTVTESFPGLMFQCEVGLAPIPLSPQAVNEGDVVAGSESGVPAFWNRTGGVVQLTDGGGGAYGLNERGDFVGQADGRAVVWPQRGPDARSSPVLANCGAEAHAQFAPAPRTDELPEELLRLQRERRPGEGRTPPCPARIEALAEVGAVPACRGD